MEVTMFTVRYAVPPQVAFLEKHEHFRVSGTIKIVSRYYLSGNALEKIMQWNQYEIILQTLKFLEPLPFCGRIGIAIKNGRSFLYGNIEAWNQEAEFRIDQTLMELEVFLLRFSQKHPGFRQTTALSYFPEPSLLH